MTEPPFETVFSTVTVEVEASAAITWSVLLDRAKWMEAFKEEALIEGESEQAGALWRVANVVEANVAKRWERYLHVERARRLTVRIWADWSPMLSHADFMLEPHGSRCSVTASIHTVMPRNGPVPADRVSTGTQAKITADFRRLASVAAETAAR